MTATPHAMGTPTPMPSEGMMVTPTMNQAGSGSGAPIARNRSMNPTMDPIVVATANTNQRSCCRSSPEARRKRSASPTTPAARNAMPNSQAFSATGTEATFVGLSMKISDVSSIRAMVRISSSANAAEYASPTVASHDQRRDIGRPSGKRVSSCRKSPAGTTRVTSQYPSHPAHTAPGSLGDEVSPAIA